MLGPVRSLLRLLVPDVIRRRYTLKYFLILLVLGLSIVVVSTAVTGTLTDQIESNTRHEYATVAGQESQKVFSWHNENKRMADVLRNVPTIRTAAPDAIREYITAEESKRRGRVSSIHYVDRSTGQVVASSNDKVDGRALAAFDAPWTTDARTAEEITVTNVYNAGEIEDHRSIVAYVAPVESDDASRPDSAIVLIVRASSYNSRFQSIDQTVSLVVGTDRKIVFSQAYNTGLTYGGADGNATPLTQARQLEPYESGATTYEANNALVAASLFAEDEQLIVGYSKVPDTPWVVLVHTTQQNAYGFAQAVNRYGTLAGGGIALLVGLVGLALGANTARSINRLRAKTREIEAGALDVDFETGRIDSIGLLYAAYDNMQTALREKVTELERAREDAEQFARDAEEAREEAEELAGQLKIEKQRSDERFRTLFETAPDPVVVVSANGAIDKVNPAFGETFDVEPGAAIGQTLVDIGVTSEEFATAFDHGLERTAPDDEFGRTLTFTYEETESTERYIELNADRLCEDGEVTGWVGILRDVTEREQTRQKLEEKNDRLENFANIVSHDLRNPLSVARGHLDLVRETGATDSLDQIDRSLDRMAQLIDEILTLAQQGETITERSTVDLSAVVTAAWETADTGGATLQIDDGLGTVEADESRLTQLFENLFRNAVDHNSETVTISVGPIEDCGFYVADDGCGIPESKREQVLERGFTTSTDGTGFGLSIVGRIVDAHGWEITVTESENGGAQFEIHSGTQSAVVE
jgi:PAS domain S-box-containing protein